MSGHTPLADLIESRMTDLGLDRQALGFRLGYQNPLNAARRVDALVDGYIISRKSRAALARLPGAQEQFEFHGPGLALDGDVAGQEPCAASVWFCLNRSKWFIRHVTWYDGGLSSAGDVPCAVPLFACVT